MRVQADILDGGPDDGQATGLRGEDVGYPYLHCQGSGFTFPLVGKWRMFLGEDALGKSVEHFHRLMWLYKLSLYM
jgi:hypothetical protein